MGNKINANGFRVGVYHKATRTGRGWNATWFPAKNKDYAKLIEADHIIRKVIKERHQDSAVQKVEIIRTVAPRGSDVVEIAVHTARPGALIGKKGSSIDATVTQLKKLLPNQRITIKAVEIRDPDIYANVVADSVRRQLEARKPTRRIMKQVVDAAIAGGAKGCKLEIAGRVDGAEIARTMKYSEGSVPRHTLRANVDFGFAEAWTKYGILGVKVWIYRGDED